MLVLQRIFEAVHLLIRERLDCADVAERLRSHIAQLCLGLLVCDGERFSEFDAEARDQDLR